MRSKRCWRRRIVGSVSIFSRMPPTCCSPGAALAGAIMATRMDSNEAWRPSSPGYIAKSLLDQRCAIAERSAFAS
jgi:hypothetical protein